MMRNSGAFGERGLCGANIEAAVELGGVTSDDFAAEFSSQKNSQRGFAGSGRPDDGEQRWNISDTHHRKKMCQPRMMRMARTITARSRLPRTCWRTIFTARYEAFLAMTYRSLAASIGRLYRKMKRRRISGPENAGGKWSKGLEERIAETAARPHGSLPEPSIRCGSSLGTLPSRRMLKSSTTLPRSPSWADSGITAYQLRRTLARTRCM